MLRNEACLCLNCFANLPRTGFHHIKDNEVARIFWGRIQVMNATSFMYFTRNSRFRQILHELKYNGQQNIGFELGRVFGLELRNTSFAEADLIHPVPLHAKKLRQRGYNQSELIARGMACVLNKPVETGLLTRTEATPTQTRKSRYERWENVRDSFVISDSSQLDNRHVLLVDDVITTGATIEACASVLTHDTKGISISIASLAYAKLQ